MQHSKKIFFLCVFVLKTSSFLANDGSDVINDYKNVYLNSYIKDLKWNGSKISCYEGYIKKEDLDKACRRINYFRKLVGLPDIKLKEVCNKKAQKAAFLVKINNQISHNPGTAWKCYSEEAAAGAKNSNLRFYDKEDISNNEWNTITGFIRDYGDVNNSCGHRRWLLWSKARYMGFGATDKTEAVYILQDTDTISDEKLSLPEYTAYPPNGDIPKQLVFLKWSFSIPESNESNFKNAKVVLRDYEGKEIKIKVYKIKDDSGDPTITWKTLGLFKPNSNDELFESYINTNIYVSIENVEVNGKIKNYNYTVRIIKI